MKQGDKSGVCGMASASPPGQTCFFAKLERVMGFEPTTCRLATDGSTAELRPQKPFYRHAEKFPLYVLTENLEQVGRFELPYSWLATK